jgi:hypothetical protein
MHDRGITKMFLFRQPPQWETPPSRDSVYNRKCSSANKYAHKNLLKLYRYNQCCGSGAFLTPVSWIRDGEKSPNPGSRINIPDPEHRVQLKNTNMRCNESERWRQIEPIEKTSHSLSLAISVIQCYNKNGGGLPNI